MIDSLMKEWVQWSLRDSVREQWFSLPGRSCRAVSVRGMRKLSAEKIGCIRRSNAFSKILRSVNAEPDLRFRFSYLLKFAPERMPGSVRVRFEPNF
jgi:hypothetical protein